MTDSEAMERFQALYADHHRAVYAYAVSRVGRQLADEVVSEVFLVTWRRLADVPAPALPWLLTVARNTGGRRAHTQSAIDRIVNGQFYLYAPGRTRRPQWYHDTNPAGHPGFSIPDPRTVLAARFEFAGYQVIDGIRVKHLRATDCSHLPSLGMLSEYSAGPHVLSLNVWVDTSGVVHRMSLTTSAVHTVYPLGAGNMRRTRDGRLIITVPDKAMAAALRAKLKRAPTGERTTIRIAPRGSAAPHPEVQVTALTVTFSGIGQPQRITPPAHAIQQYSRG